MARNFINYVNRSYSGGLNDTDQIEQVAENEATELKNAYISQRGTIQKRNGALLVGNDTGSTRITGLTGWIENDGTKWQLRTTGTELQYNNSGTWTTIDNAFTTNLDTEFVIANNKVYILNGTDDTHSWDGTAVVGAIGSASFTGAGLDDLTEGGTYTGGGQTYRVKIDGEGTPDTFTWSDDGGSTWEATGVAITGSAQSLSNGVTVTFGATTGHTADDLWDIACTSALTDLAIASVPTGKYGVFWKNYFFITGSSKFDGTNYPSRVWFSNLSDPDTFTTATDYFDVNISDGQDITGIAPLGELLVIFKRKSIYVMTGSNPTAWKLSSSVNNLQNVDSAIGCTSHRSIVQVGNDLWFMSDDGMRSLRRTEDNVTPQSGRVMGKVQGTIDTMNKGALDKVASILFNSRVYVAYPTGSSTYNNEVLVADTRITLDDPNNPHPWVRYTGWNPAVWATHIPSSTSVLYYGEASADSISFQAETGTNDNSASIDFDYQSPMINLREPHMKKTTRFIKLSAEQGNSVDIAVQSSPDGNVFTTHDNLNTYDGGAIWNSATWDTDTWAYIGEVNKKIPIQRASDQIMIRFRNNVADEAVKLFPYTLAIKVKKLK